MANPNPDQRGFIPIRRGQVLNPNGHTCPAIVPRLRADSQPFDVRWESGVPNRTRTRGRLIQNLSNDGQVRSR
jgi:hypothetical protein